MLEFLNWIFWSPLYLLQILFPLIFWAVVGYVVYDYIKEGNFPNLKFWEWREAPRRTTKIKDEYEDYIGI